MRVVKVVGEGEGVGGGEAMLVGLLGSGGGSACRDRGPTSTYYNHNRSINGMLFIYFQEHLHITRFI